MRIGLAAFTQEGQRLLDTLKKADFLAGHGGSEAQASFVCYDKNTTRAREWVASVFSSCQALVFVGAVGIAVRLIAPHITSKETDPAVVVLDEKGRFVIPVLSGHLGGANELAERLASLFNAQAVITTATDIHKVFAVDVWSREQGCAILDISTIKHVSARLLQGEPVGFMSDFPVDGALPQGVLPISPLESDEAMLLPTSASGGKRNISHPETTSQNLLEDVLPESPALRQKSGDEALPSVGISLSLDTRKHPFATTLHVMPKIIIAGVGCRKGVAVETFENFVLDTLDSLGLSVKALRLMASIDLKKDEPCCVSFCEKYGLEFRVFSSAELQAVAGDFSSSSFVQGVTGVDNVCERSAFAAGGNQFVLKKTSYDGMTLALAVSPWVCRF